MRIKPVGQKPAMLAAVALLCLFSTFGCRGGVSLAQPSADESRRPPSLLGYTIQVGAFAVVDNAVRLSETLNRKDLEAFYYRHESGLFKVRLGNYATRKEAERAAGELLRRKLIVDD